jgi:hypothetical protein
MSMRPRIFVALGLSVFLALVGTGVAQARWSTEPATVTSLVTAATTSGSLSGSASLTTVLRSLLQSPRIATLNLRNTSSTPLDFTFAVGGVSDADLSSQVNLILWKAGATGCGLLVPTTGAVRGTVRLPPVLPSGVQSAAANTSLTVCAATQLNALAILNQERTLTATFSITGTVPGSTWATTFSDAPFTQCVRLLATVC